MGRITIFTTDDCVHCTRLTDALQNLQIPFTLISLSSYPHRRKDMLSLSDRLTVPQVFFNDQHIGGADSTISVLEKWDASFLRRDDSKPLERYEEEIGSLPDPTDPRLQPSTEPPALILPPPKRPESDRVILPNGNSVTFIEIIEILTRILPQSVKKYKQNLFKHSFTGIEALAALQDEFVLKEGEAIAFGNQLCKAHIWHPLVKSYHMLEPSEKCIYRLQRFHMPEILNSFRVWTTTVDSDTMALVLRLTHMLNQIEKDVTNKETGEVNYARVRTHEQFSAFSIYEEAACELQRVNLARLNAKTLMAFGINLYNLMIKYAFMKLGVTTSSRSRTAFFNKVKFYVGRDTFSFQDWEHGVLRGNRKPPFSFKTQFGKKDPRLSLAKTIAPNKSVDCRIHFALNCGAKSCPPMRTFTAEGIDEELRIVSQAFCECDDNVEINVKKRTVRLNKILSWYRADFCASDKELPRRLLEYLRGEKRVKMKQLLNDGKSVSISFRKYDWSTEASDSLSFDSAVLRADRQQIHFAVPRFKSSKAIKATKIHVSSKKLNMFM